MKLVTRDSGLAAAQRDRKMQDEDTAVWQNPEPQVVTAGFQRYRIRYEGRMHLGFSTTMVIK